MTPCGSYKEISAKFKQFNIRQNIQNHLTDFENSIADQEIASDKEKSEKLIVSLEDDAKLELQSMPNIRINKSNYEWLKNKLLNLYLTKTKNVKQFINIFIFKERLHEHHGILNGNSSCRY